jgi:predicted O-methyltransferase YrrM
MHPETVTSRVRRYVRTVRRDPLDVVMSIDGQISRPEASELRRLARATPSGGDIVEIGSYRGRSTVALALGSREGHANRVFAVDPHVPFTGVRGSTFGPADRAALDANLAAAGVEDIVDVVSLPSVAAARAWNGRTVALLWIDGDHAEDAVRADVHAWLPFLQSDAVVAFHDADLPSVASCATALVSTGALRPLGRIDTLLSFTVSADACVTA